MGNVYIGNNAGTASKVTNAYIGINNVARKIKAIYVGINGIARLVWNGGVKKILSKYLYFNLGNTYVELYNYDTSYNTKRSANVSNYKKSEQLQCGFLCTAYSSWNNINSSGATYYVSSIQRFSVDDNNNLTSMGSVQYDYSFGNTLNDGSWYMNTKTTCDFYLELGDYLFLCLRTITDTNNTNKYYSVRDWSGNEICSASQSYNWSTWDYTLRVTDSGVAFSDSVVILGIPSYYKLSLGVITFNGSSLSQQHYFPVYIDSNGTSHYLKNVYNFSVSVGRLDNNIGILAFQGSTENTSEISTGTFAIAFKLNNDNSITFGKTMYVKEGYSDYERTSTGILMGVDKNHAILYENYDTQYSSGTYFYSKKWYALYIDDNLNISITDRYDFHSKSGVSTSKNCNVNIIGNSKTFGVPDPDASVNVSTSYGIYLYTLDTSTNKIKSLGSKLFPQSCNDTSTNYKRFSNFCPLGDDKICVPSSQGTDNNKTFTKLTCCVGKFAE